MASTRNTLRRSTSMRALAAATPLALLAAGLATGANAALVISTGATHHVSCGRIACRATASNAVLNVSALRTKLVSSAVKLVSGTLAGDIEIEAPLTWVNKTHLTLDSYHSIVIDEAVSDAGPGGLTLKTNDGGAGGTLSFGASGNVTFMSSKNKLTIDGAAYTLVANVAELAAAIKASQNGTGNYALLRNYDAKKDGAYASSPIQTEFNGTFEGLGNTVSNLTISDGGIQDTYDGLFFENSAGTIRDFGLVNASVSNGPPQAGAFAGTLAAINEGTIWRCWATGGAVNDGTAGFAGGLIAQNSGGTITQSWANVAVAAAASSSGGLVGQNGGSSAIVQSYATGTVSSPPTSDSVALGGLVGEDDGMISQSYATGAVSLTNSGAASSDAGGLVGYESAGSNRLISQSYSTGAVSSASGNANSVGGLIGFDDSGAGGIVSSYWDISSSGITNLSQGAGNIANDPGITGLTSKQFKSGLPAGFDPAVWGEHSGIDNHFPYLLALPPS